MFQVPWHYAHALNTRLFLLREGERLRRTGRALPKGLRRDIWRAPAAAEDWVNLLRFLDPAEPLLLVDVGANVGAFAAQFKRVFPNTRVVACEPTTQAFNKLRARFANDPSVELHRVAVSSAPGRRAIRLAADDTMSSFEAFTAEVDPHRASAVTGSEEVSCVTLDGLNPRADGRKTVLKVDVQGHETEVFAGAGGFLRRVDLCLVELSFADEYQDREPSFSTVCAACRNAGLYPIVFQDYGYEASSYAYERDVVFVRRPLLRAIF